MGHDVFISYSSKDKTAGEAVATHLESRSIGCWIAPRDICPGADWTESIMDAIRPSRVMVLVFSHHANGSVQIKREVERAIHHGIPIIPFRIEQVLPTGSLEYTMATCHWLDAYAPPMDSHLNYLADVVQAILNKQPAPPAPPPGVPPRGAWMKYAIAALLMLAPLLYFVWPHPSPPSNPTPISTPAPTPISTPPSLQGDWKLSSCSLTPNEALPQAALLQNAFTTGRVNGTWELSALNDYVSTVEATDSGTVTIEPSTTSDSDPSSAKAKLTFVSGSTHKALASDAMIANITGADAPMPATSLRLFLGGNPPMVISRKPGSDESNLAPNDPAHFRGTWDFVGMAPNFLWSGTLSIKSDGTYLLSVTHNENAIIDVADGAWSLTDKSHLQYATMVGAGFFAAGHYSFEGANMFHFASTSGSFTFTRGK